MTDRHVYVLVLTVAERAHCWDLSALQTNILDSTRLVSAAADTSMNRNVDDESSVFVMYLSHGALLCLNYLACGYYTILEELTAVVWLIVKLLLVPVSVDNCFSIISGSFILSLQVVVCIFAIQKNWQTINNKQSSSNWLCCCFSAQLEAAR